MARFIMPFYQEFNNSAEVLAGAKLNFYSTGTTTRKDTFSDSARTTANANPVVADSAGRFGDIFLESGTYRVILTDADDVTIGDADPVEGAIGTSGAVDEKSADHTVTVSDATKVLNVDASGAARTITLLAAATATDGFEITVKKSDSSANAVTVDGNGSETIDGATTYVLSLQYAWVTLRCDGSNWLVVASGRDFIGTSKFFAAVTFAGEINADGPLALGDGSELTISSGSITPTACEHRVDTESDAASDDLDTIDDANMQDGALLLLRAENTGRTVVVKNGTGNHAINLANNVDYTIDDTEKSLLLRLQSGEWYEVIRSVPSRFTSSIATTSGTTRDITDIPPGTNDVVISLEGVSQNSASQTLLLQLGDSGGIETSGYSGANARHVNASNHANTANSAGVVLGNSDAAELLTGQLRCTHMGSNIWSYAWIGDDDSTGEAYTTSGNKTLSGELTQVRLTTAGGSATFDAGTMYLFARN